MAGSGGKATSGGKMGELVSEREAAALCSPVKRTKIAMGDMARPDSSKVRHYVDNLCMRRMLKENHGAAIQRVQFSRAHPSNSNIVGSVGDVQCNVYDSMHVGEHLDLMLNFTNVAVPGHIRHTTLTCFAFLGQDSDVLCIAIAGADAAIQIISVNETRVVRLLLGHSAAVTDVCAAPAAAAIAHVLLSCSPGDSSVRLWNWRTGAALAVISYAAAPLDAPRVAVFAPDASAILVGARSAPTLFQLPEQCVDDAAAASAPDAAPAILPMQQGRVLASLSALPGVIDSIAFADQDVAVFKTDKGRIVALSIASGVVMATASLPGAISRLDVTFDGQFVAVGSRRGEIIVYDLTQQLREYRRFQYQNRTPDIHDVAWSADARHLFFAGDSIIWCLDYVPPSSSSADAAA